MNKFTWFLIAVISFGMAYMLYTRDVVAPSSESDMTAMEKTSHETSDTPASIPTHESPDVASEEKSVSIAQPLPATHDERGNIFVRYTSQGFDPQVVDIRPGDTVHFINMSTFPMWIKAQAHPNAEYYEYASLNEGRSVPFGESYLFTFTRSGAWGYINLNNDAHKGAVVVGQ